MGKSLIIAEKPSVASDIARALGGFDRHKDYFENEHYVLSSAIGHLLEICPPEGCEAKRGKWTFAHLPVIPPHFDLKPIEKTEGRLKLLTRLAKRKDVTGLVNACDAGREGELIFRYIVQHCHSKKPIQRLWLQSMTQSAIREGFERLRTDEQMQGLAHAAYCRSEADWLVGINGTRAMTAFNSKTGGFYLTPVGRVQTPTLAVVVAREKRIRAFVPRDYWEIHASFTCEAGPYEGRWLDEAFSKGRPPEGLGKEDHRTERLWDRSRAEVIRDKCLGQTGVATEESKPTTQAPPLLYDLTSLQREANGRFGFSASATLRLAQSLYERHKVLTYPRTDSRALPEDYPETVRKTLRAMSGTSFSDFAGRVLTEGWVRPNRRVFNNSRVSDHFAIIPTPQTPKNLNEGERKLYDLVAKRFLAAFYPPAEFLVTTRLTRVADEPFKTEGKVMVNAGWLVVYGRDTRAGDAPQLPPIENGEEVTTDSVTAEAFQTKPPARYTEATLLSAMEGAGKLVGDDELRDAMKEKGLGTPATRAQIIDGLVHEKYLNREQRELFPTAKAFSLMELLKGLGVEALTKPELTGEWEFKLKQMEQGRLPREDFMRQIRELTTEVVGKAKSFEHDTIPGDFGKLEVPCPKCGGEVHETYRRFQCKNCGFSANKVVASRPLEYGEVETLLRERRVGPLQGFRSRQGRPFAAALKLDDSLEVKFDFGDDDGDNESSNGDEPPDFSGQEPVGKCPKCGSSVFESGKAYLCEKGAGKEKKCDFRVGALILQQPVSREQLGKLLTGGKSDLLDKFISRKGRPFKAFLVMEEGGKVGFEFEKREPRKKASKDKAPEAPVDFSNLSPVADCPLCGGKVYDAEKNYLCENSQRTSRPCKLKLGKVILRRPITIEELGRLLSDRRTDLLTKFISSKTGRPFSAFLVLTEKGKVEFEFPARA